MGQNLHAKFTDAQNEIRIAIMNFIIDNKRQFNLESDGFSALENINLSSNEDYSDIVAVLKEKDGLVPNSLGDVNFIYPVSALPTHHRVTLADGREFTAMCAIDALGAAFTFEQDSEVHSKCSMCGKQVYVKIRDGKVGECSPEGLHALSFDLSGLVNWATSC